MKNFKEATKCYDEALQINPKHSYAYNNKVCALEEIEKISEPTRSCYPFEKTIKNNSSSGGICSIQ